MQNHKNLKYRIDVYAVTNPHLRVRTYSNNIKNRVARLKENIRAHQGTIGDWANFERFLPFADTPVEDIRFDVYEAQQPLYTI